MRARKVSTLELRVEVAIIIPRLLLTSPLSSCVAQRKPVWKKYEKVSGEIVVHDDFKVVIVTRLPRKDVLKELDGPLPMEHMKPIVVKFGS